MNAIEVNNVSKSYGAVKALDEVSFTVGKGEVFGLIGPDGAGKTTLFRTLCTLLLPDKGTALVDGFDTVRQMKEIRQRVGYMPGRFSLYQDLTVINAFKKADDTLSVAAKSIAEIITMRGIINMDFQDVTTVLKNGGVAIMSTGFGEGSGRVTKAIEEALHSPLLNNNDIYNSKKVLLNINFSSDDGKDSLMMEEINEVNDFMAKFKEDVEVKWGLATDPTLGNKVKITLLASGFGLQGITGITNHDKEKAAAEAQRHHGGVLQRLGCCHQASPQHLHLRPRELRQRGCHCPCGRPSHRHTHRRRAAQHQGVSEGRP